MDRPHPYPLRAAVAAIAAGFTICAAAAERVEHVSTQTEFSAPAADPSSSVDIEAALARVNAARSRADADPLALEDALTALGDAFLDASQYATAEAAYDEALRLAEQHGGLESERVLAPLLGLGNTLAGSGHHQRSRSSPAASGGDPARAVWIVRPASAGHAQDVGRQPHCARSHAGSAGSHDLQGARRGEDVRRRKPEGHSVAVRPGGLVRRNRHVPRGSHDFSDGAQHRWRRGVSERPDHRRAPARDRADVHAQDELSGGLAAPARRHPAAVARGPCRLPYRMRRRRASPSSNPGSSIRKASTRCKRALRILEADPGASTQTRIETLIQMGDWYQIKKSPREALPYYQRAWQLIRTSAESAGLRGHCAERSAARLLSDTSRSWLTSRRSAGRNALPLRADRVHCRR